MQHFRINLGDKLLVVLVLNFFFQTIELLDMSNNLYWLYQGLIKSLFENQCVYKEI